MKVGEYARTKNCNMASLIGKIIKEEYITPCNAEHKYIYLIDMKDNDVWFEEDNILKSRPKTEIIDLIEVGDYVNGSKVQEIGEGYVEIEEYSGLNNDMPCVVKIEDIKSIVTKEQFESMQYNLESEVNYIMKITIYELIGLIKDKKQPLKIKFEDKILNYDEKCQNYEFRYDNSNEDGSLNWDYLVFNCLNEYVEILESQV